MIHRVQAETLEGMDGLLSMGEKFYRELHLPGSFVKDAFVQTWKQLMSMDIGAIWYCSEGGQTIGAIGCVIHPDACDHQMVAQEMFWFMDPAHRSGFSAVKLYNCIEEWAREKGCRRIAMASILGDNTPSLARFYKRMGFRPVDVSFFKDLV